MRINSILTSPSCKEVGKIKPLFWKANNQSLSIFTPAQLRTEISPAKGWFCMVKRLRKQNETQEKDVLQHTIKKMKTHTDRSKKETQRLHISFQSVKGYHTLKVWRLWDKPGWKSLPTENRSLSFFTLNFDFFSYQSKMKTLF